MLVVWLTVERPSVIVPVVDVLPIVVVVAPPPLKLTLPVAVTAPPIVVVTLPVPPPIVIDVVEPVKPPAPILSVAVEPDAIAPLLMFTVDVDVELPKVNAVLLNVVAPANVCEILPNVANVPVTAGNVYEYVVPVVKPLKSKLACFVVSVVS